MFHSLAQQHYQYSRGMSAADQRAADARLGEAAAALRDLRHSLRRALRARLGRTAAPVVTAAPATMAADVRPAGPARVLAGVR